MKQKPCSPHKRKHPKTRLGLPDLEYWKAAVLNSLTSTDGQRGYGHAIDEFVDWYCSEPRRKRRVGPDPVPSGACLHSDDRTLLRMQAADWVGSQ